MSVNPFRRAQARLGRALGLDHDGREEILVELIGRDGVDRATYWFQLLVATGISILGLVNGSTAVVIAAMLVAPLMQPILALGMGLSTGSPFLVVRSTARVLASVIATVGMSAGITLLIPFHQVNAEIAARTAPTVLDLFLAGFCALAGVYATIRPGSDTASTAAGTSIGISLVPPLCVAGYGLATASAEVASGAGLLFVTNMVAIVAVASAGFVAVGFGSADVLALEAAELANEDRRGLPTRIARVVAHAFESPGGPWLRFVMPLLLLAAVLVPLRRGLDDVAWQVRVLTGLERLVAGLDVPVVQSHLRVEGGRVEARLVVVGTDEDADRARSTLDDEVRLLAGVAPTLQVVAVAQSDADAGLAPAAEVPAWTTSTTLAPVKRWALDALTAAWPVQAAGEPVDVQLSLTQDGLALRVAHLGPPLDAAAREAVARAVGTATGKPARLADLALPAAPVPLDELTEADLAHLLAGLASAAELAGVEVCVALPPTTEASPARALVAAALVDHPAVVAVEGEVPVVFFGRPCPEPPASERNGAAEGG